MLTMRNGLSLHPMCLPGVLQPVQLPLAGMSFDEENGLLNANPVAGAFSANEDSAAQTGLTLPEHRTIPPNQSIAIPSVATIPSPETSFGFEPLIQVQYGPFSLTPSSKVTLVIVNKIFAKFVRINSSVFFLAL